MERLLVVRFIIFGTRESDASVFFDMLSSHLHPAKTFRDAIWKLRGREKDGLYYKLTAETH
ncbi:MAG: hypothetical protein QXG05_07270 [Nitrososphaerota archaeon]